MSGSQWLRFSAHGFVKLGLSLTEVQSTLLAKDSLCQQLGLPYSRKWAGSATRWPSIAMVESVAVVG